MVDERIKTGWTVTYSADEHAERDGEASEVVERGGGKSEVRMGRGDPESIRSGNYCEDARKYIAGDITIIADTRRGVAALKRGRSGVEW